MRAPIIASGPLRSSVRAICVLAMACAAWMLPTVAAADYPDKPIRLIVPQAPGSATDVLARLLGAELGLQLGQTIVIDNRPGGALTLGLDLTAKSAPDGYTLCMGPIGALAITRHMVAKLPYDIERDFQPIALVSRGHLLLAVSTELPVMSVKELIDYAKKNPGKLLNASSSNGSPGHVGGELFKFMTGTKILHVPYKGGAQAINDLIAGHPPDVREPQLDLVDRQVRQGARARRQRTAALAGVSRAADHRRGRRAGLRRRHLERRDRAVRPAEADRREAQHGDQPRDFDAGLQGTLRRHRRRAGWRHRPGIRRDHRQGFRQVGGRDQALGRQARLMSVTDRKP
jgi:Tripartite tricarboxylate transporter family receptor